MDEPAAGSKGRKTFIDKNYHDDQKRSRIKKRQGTPKERRSERKMQKRLGFLGGRKRRQVDCLDCRDDIVGRNCGIWQGASLVNSDHWAEKTKLEKNRMRRKERGLRKTEQTRARRKIQVNMKIEFQKVEKERNPKVFGGQ